MKLIAGTLFLFVTAMGSVRAEQSALSKQFEGFMVAHHYVAVHLAFAGGNQQSVDAQINGKRVTLIVDTGSPRSCLTYQCARSLGLDIHDTGRTTSGLGGEIKGHEGVAMIQSFKFPFGEINRTNTIAVLPPRADIGSVGDGILGLDFLGLNAAVYPVGGAGVLLKPGPSPAVPIGDYMAQLGFRPVPLTLDDGHLWVDGHINGHAMKFMVDSGAVLSNFRADSVRLALGQEMDSTDLPLSGIDGKRETSFDFKPASMDVGGFSIQHESFMATQSAGFETGKYDGLVGVDLMGGHHGIIDLGDKILWMKE